MAPPGWLPAATGGGDVGQEMASQMVRNFLRCIGADEARRAIKAAMVEQGIPEHVIEDGHVEAVWLEMTGE